ncbi:MAG TPA: hypothetical protein VGI32_17485 [Steroidobacteraceae bacterium]|jgi:hypothetical protein
MISASPAIGSASARTGIGRYFFVSMAALVLLTVFAGFAPSFYLRSAFHPDHQLSVLLHIHGLVFSAWIILFLAQTILIAKGSRRLHQVLGWLTVGVAAAMVLLVAAATVEQMRRGLPLDEIAADLSFNLFGTIMFGVPLIAAIYRRKRPDWHKRLMLCATLSLLGAPVLRLILLTTNFEFPTAVIWGIVATDMFFLPCFAYDLLTRGRIHRAYAYGLGLIVVSEIVMLNLLSWPPWLNFSRSVQHLLS